ncbi:MAG TPA: HD domain-containing protein [Jeotgalicoccus sp.]|nr:HD domain-containing protein [Jeotgalicoccus sp.]
MIPYKNQKLKDEKVFKDPVHSYAHVTDQVIWDLIKTREFQRLRRIRQLGTLYMAFHSAEHSRFNHSLGVYEIVRIMIRNFRKYDVWDDDDRVLALSAALLHDLGHGPFSHSFEKIFNTDHEDYTRKIILGDTEVNKVLRRVSDTFPEEVASVIDHTHPNKLIVSMISSQIDADRMDYLQRDAYFTGVEYGKFDIDRLLRVMIPTQDEILIKETGMHAVEDYLMSRYQMYWQVYFHPVSRGGEVLLTLIFRRAKELYKAGYTFLQEPKYLKPFFDENVTVEDYLKLDEMVVNFYLQEWMYESDRVLSELSDRFVNRELFKYIPFDGSFITMSELEALFTEAGLDPKYNLFSDSYSDMPYDYDRPGNKDTRRPIHLLKKNGDVREISSQSIIINSITGIHRYDSKLYFPKEKVNNIEDENLKSRILNLLDELS